MSPDLQDQWGAVDPTVTDDDKTLRRLQLTAVSIGLRAGMDRQEISDALEALGLLEYESGSVGWRR